VKKRAKSRVRRVWTMTISRIPSAFFIVLLSSCTILPTTPTHSVTKGRTVFVSNKDGSSGAQYGDQSFSPLARAIATARPGDTILIEPGTYSLRSEDGVGLRITRSGRSAAPITLSGDGGEAILDCSDMLSSDGVICLQLQADWWHLSNIAVTGARQNSNGSWSVGMSILNGSDNLFQALRSFNNQGPGIYVSGSSARNHFELCEAFNNYDPRSRNPGGNADGIQLTRLSPQSTGNVLKNCRAYGNSDDGFDLWETEAPVTIESSHSFDNGYVPGTRRPAGDGDGFKLGRNLTGPDHRLLYNVATENRGIGFDPNGAAGPATMIGNKAYHNSGGN